MSCCSVDACDKNGFVFANDRTSYTVGATGRLVDFGMKFDEFM
jgi:hypothetical protein